MGLPSPPMGRGVRLWNLTCQLSEQILKFPSPRTITDQLQEPLLP